MPTASLLAFAQLLRLPNVFTAFADIALAGAVGVGILASTSRSFWGSVALLALASGCLYLTGMVTNDLFDRAEDARTRPFRPIPSGRVHVKTAICLSVILMILGLLLAWLASQLREETGTPQPLIYALAIVGAVLLYNGWLKHTVIGPVAMAVCRFLNVLFGLSLIPTAALEIGLRCHLAGIVGLYIMGVTWFARTEERLSQRSHLIAAAGLMAASLLLALMLKSRLPAESGTVAFPYLLVLFGFVIGWPIARAVQTPKPRQVQIAVKQSVIGLVLLDALLATAFVGLWGLLLLLLLLPVVILGKWLYST
jgi:4-hydroxybenzoate polyprenyltransferase